jgi:hypothetical protein
MGQGGFAIELVRELLLLRHDVGMRARRQGQSFIQVQGRGSGVRPGLIGHLQELLFGLGVGVEIREGLVSRGNRAI